MSIQQGHPLPDVTVFEHDGQGAPRKDPGVGRRGRSDPSHILMRTRPDHPIGLRALPQTSRARTDHGARP
jgi:hypothetical protein